MQTNDSGHVAVNLAAPEPRVKADEPVGLYITAADGHKYIVHGTSDADVEYWRSIGCHTEYLYKGSDALNFARKWKAILDRLYPVDAATISQMRRELGELLSKS